MEVARLVAFALGVYVAGGVFALAAARLWARRRVSGASAGGASAADVVAPTIATLTQLASLDDAWESGDDAPQRTIQIDAPPPRVDAEVDEPSPRVEPADVEPPSDAATDAPSDAEPAPSLDARELARLARERDEALALRAALELEVAEGAPLRERVAWLARRVEELERSAARGDEGASALAAAARRMLAEHAALAARERDALEGALALREAELATTRAAHRAAWGPVVARLVELDRHLDRLDAERRRADDDRAAKERALEEAQSLVRAERRVAEEIRRLLAHHLGQGDGQRSP